MIEEISLEGWLEERLADEESELTTEERDARDWTEDPQ